MEIPLADADFEKARAAFLKGRHRQAVASVEARMAAISREARRAFALLGRPQERGDEASPRAFLDRYLGGSDPILRIHRDRFFFRADLYRLHAHAAFGAGDARAAAASFTELIASDQATDDDRQNALALVALLGEAALGLKDALTPRE